MGYSALTHPTVLKIGFSPMAARSALLIITGAGLYLAFSLIGAGGESAL
jgi:hypothetical protein